MVIRSIPSIHIAVFIGIMFLYMPPDPKCPLLAASTGAFLDKCHCHNEET